jgi:ubiquinone/menaquinone biosynthesis C-methylase UbiE
MEKRSKPLDNRAQVVLRRIAAEEVAGDAIPDYESYDYSGVWAHRGLEDRAEKELVLRWATGESGLELGGGFGRITEVIEPRFEKMFMLDYSLGNLRRASSKLKRTILVRSSLDRLPFDNCTFDFIALIRVMHHIPHPASLLDEVARVARNGATFVMAVANEQTTGNKKLKGHSLKYVSPQGHRIYSTPLSSYSHPSLERVENRGVGIFDNRVGRRLEWLSPLFSLDVATSLLWPVKPMLFIRFRVKKTDRERNESIVKCVCGGSVLSGRCDRCERIYGERTIDLVDYQAAGI